MTRFKVMTVVGARPQFVKAAALSRAFAARTDLAEVLVHTGQHYDAGMSRVFFDELQLAEPHYNLGVSGGGHGEMTGRMLISLEKVMLAERPDLVVVPGDTTSTLAGALAAAKLHIPVAHVEAGLRSFNRRMPEEINRVLADHVSTVLFCPTDTAVSNLRHEGVVTGVHDIGDVMYDAALFAADASRSSDALARLGVEGNYAVATVHRAENTDDRATLAEIVDFLTAKSSEHAILFPVHPRTRERIARWELDVGALRVCEPLGYLDMHRLLHSAERVYTDSGGLQKEAYFHRVPCVTLRDETEWLETIDAGWNRLWKGPDFAVRRDIAAYGDGHAADRAAQIIADYLAGRHSATA